MYPGVFGNYTINIDLASKGGKTHSLISSYFFFQIRKIQQMKIRLEVPIVGVNNLIQFYRSHIIDQMKIKIKNLSLDLYYVINGKF